MVDASDGLIHDYTQEMFSLLSQLDNATDENEDPVRGSTSNNSSKSNRESPKVHVPEWAGVWKSSLEAMQMHGSPAAVSAVKRATSTEGESGGLGVSSSAGEGVGGAGGRGIREKREKMVSKD